MKSTVIALFIGATSAVKLQDAPPYFNQPTWNEKFPSAAGFVQLSACNQAGISGVTCGPSDVELFATGMNGDEDLGQDITMKGEKFHFNEENQMKLAQAQNPVVASGTYTLPPCHGTNGPDGVNCVRQACSGTNGIKDGPVGTPCERAQPDNIPHYNTDPTAGRPYETTGDLTRNALHQRRQALAQEDDEDVQLSDVGAEKVSILQTPVAFGHTTYY